MTREEAIKELKKVNTLDMPVRLCEAYYMSIEALEQEPCEDAISRQAVLDLISKFIFEIHTEGGRDLNAHTNDVLRQILRNINSDEVLPSVNPQEPKTGQLTNSEWIDFLSEQFDISRTSAKEMLHVMMSVKKEDNFKKQFSGRK